MKSEKKAALARYCKPHLYAVRMLIPGCPFDPIKVGFTYDPKGRRASYNSGPFPVEWIGHWRGTEADEKGFHARYRHMRLEGEWFEPSVEMLDEINRSLGIDYPRRAPGFYLRARQDRAFEVLADHDAVMMRGLM